MNQQTNDDLQTQVNVLKNAMQFYSNEENYINDQLIIKDGGGIARHALKSINDLAEYQQQISELQNFIADDTEDDVDRTELVNKINKLIKNFTK